MFDDFKNAFQRHNNAHIQLIIINIIIFVVMAVVFVFSRALQYDQIAEFVHMQVAIPSPVQLFLQKPWTIITYAFVHDLSDIWHIFFNMLGLYWFGKLFVEYLGSDKLIALYVLGAIAGAIAYLLTYNTIPFFIERNPSYMVGASAAVFAIVVATATLLPDYTFFLLFFGPVKIKYIAAIYVFGSFLASVGANAGGNIAHLGGALIGFVYLKQLQAGSNWGNWITLTLQWTKNLFKPKPAVKVTYRKNEPYVSKPSKSSKVSQEELDAILDKISDGGYESLTKEEKEKLFNASKK
jgi:membrane associated rhomboid family serine protease